MYMSLRFWWMEKFSKQSTHWRQQFCTQDYILILPPNGFPPRVGLSYIVHRTTHTSRAGGQRTCNYSKHITELEIESNTFGWCNWFGKKLTTIFYRSWKNAYFSVFFGSTVLYYLCGKAQIFGVWCVHGNVQLIPLGPTIRQYPRCFRHAISIRIWTWCEINMKSEGKLGYKHVCATHAHCVCSWRRYMLCIFYAA